MPHGQLKMFSCGEMLVGVPVENVDRVISACEISPLPKSPPIIYGIINVHGTVMPVFSVNVRFGLPPQALHPDNFIILCSSPGRKLALLTDNLIGLRDYGSETVVPSDGVLPTLDHVKGIIKTEDGMVIVQDLNRFLSLEEERAVDVAIADYAGD